MLDRSGFAKDRDHVYQLDRPISDDPAHFELLDGGLSKDSTAVYWTDGGCCQTIRPFRDCREQRPLPVHEGQSNGPRNGKPIADADPSTFRVLQGAYAQDARHVYYFSDPVLNADAASFRPLDGPYAAMCTASTGWARRSTVPTWPRSVC